MEVEDLITTSEEIEKEKAQPEPSGKSSRWMSIRDIFRAYLRREPAEEEVNMYDSGKLSLSDIETELKNSFEATHYAIKKQPLAGYENWGKVPGEDPDIDPAIADIVYPEGVTGKYQKNYAVAYMDYKNKGFSDKDAQAFAFGDIQDLIEKDKPVVTTGMGDAMSKYVTERVGDFKDTGVTMHDFGLYKEYYKGQGLDDKTATERAMADLETAGLGYRKTGKGYSYSTAGLSSKDFKLQMQSYIDAGFSAPEASQMAMDDMNQYVQKYGKQQATQAEMQKYISAYPEEVKKATDTLAGQLSKYSGEYFGKEIQPRIQEGMAARGLQDSGALNVALAEAAADLEREREGQIAPMVAQGTITQQQMQYQDLLNRAAQAGVNLSTPSMFYQMSYAPTLAAQQQSLAQGAQERMAGQGYRNQLAMLGKTQAFQGAESRANRSWQDYWLNRDLQSKNEQASGSMLGRVGSIGLGGLLAAAGGMNPWLGALSGLTGQWFPKNTQTSGGWY